MERDEIMKTKSQGFTLIEILVGVAIVSLVFIFAYASINFSASLGADMEEQAMVGNILDVSAEYAHSKVQMGSVVSLDGLDVEAGVPGFDSYLQDTFRNHDLSVSASDYGSSDLLKKVTITFQWKPRGKRVIDSGTGLELKKSETLVTLVSEPK